MDVVENAASGEAGEGEDDAEETEEEMEQLAEQLEQVDMVAGGHTDEPGEADMEQLADQLNEVDTAAGDLSDFANALIVTDNTDLGNQAEALNDIETAAGGYEIIVPTELGDAGEAVPDNREEKGALGNDEPDTASPPNNDPVEVVTSAQGPTVTGGPVSVSEDTAIDLNISAALAASNDAGTERQL